MKTLTKLLAITCFACIFTGCEKPSNTNDCKKTIGVDSGNKTLIGQWRWVLTYVLQPDICDDTPENTGIEELFVLNADNTWAFYKNGQVISNGDSIFVGKYNDDYRPYTDSIVFFSNNTVSDVKYIIFKGGNNLCFYHPPGCTGGAEIWERKN